MCSLASLLANVVLSFIPSRRADGTLVVVGSNVVGRLSWPAVGPVCAFLYYFEAYSASLTYAGGLKAQQCSECFESTQCMVVSVLQGAHTLCAGFPNFACFQPEARELSSSVGSLLGVNSVGEFPHFHESHLSNTTVSKLLIRFET